MHRRSAPVIVFSLLILAGSAAAHFTWIAPPALTAGKPATIVIAHGHQFPVSEEAIAAAQVRAFALSPAGKRIELKAVKSGARIEATFTPAETGTYAVAFSQDRGVLSRTPAGVKPGGRDTNPDSVQSVHNVRTAVAFASTGKVVPAGKPLGLEFEIVPQVAGSSVTLQLLRSGKPVPGVAIQVLTAGAKEPVDAGKTSPQGTASWNISAGAKPPVLFMATLEEPAPARATFDKTSLSTSLYLSW